MNILTWSIVLAALIGLGVLEARSQAVSRFTATFLSYWVQETKILANPGS